jgi:hypothetical protein
MATSDHGLEVLRKAAELYLGNPNELQIRTLITGGTISAVPGPFSPPANTDYIGRSVLSNVETFLFKQGGVSGTVLKTITVTYVASDLEELLSVQVS